MSKATKKARFQQVDDDDDRGSSLLNPSGDLDNKGKFLKVDQLEQNEYDGPRKKRVDSDLRNTLTQSLKGEAPWKPAKNQSYETLVLT